MSDDEGPAAEGVTHKITNHGQARDSALAFWVGNQYSLD